MQQCQPERSARQRRGLSTAAALSAPPDHGSGHTRCSTGRDDESPPPGSGLLRPPRRARGRGRPAPLRRRRGRSRRTVRLRRRPDRIAHARRRRSDHQPRLPRQRPPGRRAHGRAGRQARARRPRARRQRPRGLPRARPGARRGACGRDRERRRRRARASQRRARRGFAHRLEPRARPPRRGPRPHARRQRGARQRRRPRRARRTRARRWWEPRRGLSGGGCMPLTRRLAVPLAALALVLGTSRAALAVCSVTRACSAAPFLALSSGCCGATTCTIDGTVTLSGPACGLDFGAHNVTLSGTLVVGSGTLTLAAGGLTVTGLLDARGTTAKPGGNVTLALGAGGLSLARGSGTAIDLEGFAAGGGTLTAVVGGRVSLGGGDIDASALETEAGGGTITLQQTAGSTPMNVGISIRANAGSDGIGGTITLQAPADLNITNTGAIAAMGGFVDGGSIELDAGGRATVAGAAVIRAAGLSDSGGDGGDISITAGSVEVDGTLDASGGSDPTRDFGGGNGTIEVEARTGALTLVQVGQGLTVDGAGGGDGGEVDLTTDSPANGALTVAGPVRAQGHGGLSGRPAAGGTIDIESAQALALTNSLKVTGVGGGFGSVTLAAQRDVLIDGPIDGRDAVGSGDVEITAGHDLTFTGNAIRVNATVDGMGGSITALASNDLTLTGFLLDAAGAGTGA